MMKLSDQLKIIKSVEETFLSHFDRRNCHINDKNVATKKRLAYAKLRVNCPTSCFFFFAFKVCTLKKDPLPQVTIILINIIIIIIIIIDIS